MIRDWKRSIVAAAVAMTLAGVGCDMLSSNKDKSSDRTGTLDRESGIPRTAKVVDENDMKVSYTAKTDGRIYLYDVTDGRLRHNANLRDGDRYTADGDKDKIFLNDRPVGNMDLVKAHQYRLYFDASRDSRNDRDDRRNDRNDRNDRGQVPDTAKVVASGRGRDLSYRAGDDGTVYLYDNTDNRLVNTFNLDRGQSLSISTDDGKAVLDGRTISRDLNTSSRHDYKLLFDRR